MYVEGILTSQNTLCTDQGYSIRDLVVKSRQENFILPVVIEWSTHNSSISTWLFQIILNLPWTYLISLSNFIVCKHNRRWRDNKYLNRISSSENKSTIFYTKTPALILVFTPCHRKYRQSKYRKAVVYFTVLHLNLSPCGTCNVCCIHCVCHCIFYGMV